MGRIAVVQTTSSKESRQRLEAFAAASPTSFRSAASRRQDRRRESRGHEHRRAASTPVSNGKTSSACSTKRAARCRTPPTAATRLDPADRPDAGPPRSFPAKLAKLLARPPSRRRRADHAFPVRIDAGQWQRAAQARCSDVLDRWEAPSEGAALDRGRLRLGQFACRPHRLRAARAARRCRRALCALGDRGPARPRAALPSRLIMVVTGDLKPYERLKLFILNLGHTYLAEIWARARRRADADCPRGDGG